ncbi:MAG: hypothetical protein IJT88_06255 [Kiritimatiellae bacterium]|nr:hypothetical protein [Kiritimatiellia bacterium]MBQ9344798.1 hypothetical protein [Kiritimatiellia bacterium]
MKKTSMMGVLLASLVAWAGAAWSQEEAASALTEADLADQNRMSDPNVVKDASDAVDDWAEAVRQTFGAKSFGENDGKILLFAAKTVAVPDTDPQFGDFLVAAYDEAMADVQEQYVMLRFGRLVVDKAREFYHDGSTGAREIPLELTQAARLDEKILKLFEKSLDVAGKKLDQELIALGVDPSELASMTEVKKKTLMMDKFTKSVMKKASGEIAGLFTVQTTVKRDGKGTVKVGVVAVASPKTRQVARDIHLQRKSLITGKGRSVTECLPKDENDWISTLGARLVYDENGAPTVLSFGVASYMPDMGDDFLNDELKEDAKTTARANAEAQIAEVVNGYMSAESEKVSGQEIERFVEREMKPDSMSVERTVKEAVKVSRRASKARAQMELKGTSPVRQWRWTAPWGQRFVGEVVAWKYSTLQAVEQFNRPLERQLEEAPAAGTPARPTGSHYGEGIRINTIDDF